MHSPESPLLSREEPLTGADDKQQHRAPVRNFAICLAAVTGLWLLWLLQATDSDTHENDAECVAAQAAFFARSTQPSLSGWVNRALSEAPSASLSEEFRSKHFVPLHTWPSNYTFRAISSNWYHAKTGDSIIELQAAYEQWLQHAHLFPKTPPAVYLSAEWDGFDEVVPELEAVLPQSVERSLFPGPEQCATLREVAAGGVADVQSFLLTHQHRLSRHMNNDAPELSPEWHTTLLELLWMEERERELLDDEHEPLSVAFVVAGLGKSLREGLHLSKQQATPTGDVWRMWHEWVEGPEADPDTWLHYDMRQNPMDLPLPFMGQFSLWNGDLLDAPRKREDMKKYDVVLFGVHSLYGPGRSMPKDAPTPQEGGPVWLQFAVEPRCQQQLLDQRYCPVLVDPYECMDQDQRSEKGEYELPQEPSAWWPYVYDVAAILRAFYVPFYTKSVLYGVEGKLRGRAKPVRQLLEKLGFEYQSRFADLSHPRQYFPQGKYMNLMQMARHKFGISYYTRQSVGQPVVELSMLGVPCFYYGSRVGGRLLQHPFMEFRDAGELQRKIVLLHNDDALYEQVRAFIFRRLRFVDMDSYPSARQFLRRIQRELATASTFRYTDFNDTNADLCRLKDGV